MYPSPGHCALNRKTLAASFERFSHLIALPELSNIPPLPRSCQDCDDETSLDSASYTGPAIASWVRHHDLCWRAWMSPTALQVREALRARVDGRDGRDTSRRAGAGNVRSADGSAPV